MQLHTPYLISRIMLYALLCLITLVSVGFAQEATSSPEESVLTGDTSGAAVPSFPYIAQIITDDVYIRSGPGTQYYSCGKLYGTDRVRIVGSQFGWSHIVPPVGSFSWISKQYVEADSDNPDTGTVTGDAVRVYAGSERIKPIHSTTVQLKLSAGDKVSLVGEEQGDYYKITPPTGAYLWVSTQYTEPSGSVGEVPIASDLQTEPRGDVIKTTPTDLSLEAKKLKEYYVLEKQIQAERTKPIVEQSYTDMKKALLEIAGDKKAGKSARYSEFTVKQIERFELAQIVAKEIQLQNIQLQQIQKQIDNVRVKKLAAVTDLGKFTAIGKLYISKIYGPQAQLQHYRLTEDSGKTICYALPSGSASTIDLDRFIGRKVGLLGKIEPHLQTANALVLFTEIVELTD